MINLADIKQHLRISHNLDDNYLENLYHMAIAFITEETGVTYEISDDKVYDQCILFLVAHLYDNRASVIDKAMCKVPYTLDHLICHIKLRGEKK